MQFESLTNELLLGLFEFIDTSHLIHAFFELNSRFDYLLYVNLKTHQFNFEFISKDDFDVIFRNHLPLLINQIISLRLSDDERSKKVSSFSSTFSHVFRSS